jgi:Smg protein
MLDILVYLYESYRMAELAPDRDALERRLFAAGFEADAIATALDWFAQIPESDPHARLAIAHFRHFAEDELDLLDDACRAELAWLERAEILDAESREWVISGLTHLAGEDIEPEHVRWMALIVLWSRGLIEHFTHLEDMLLNTEPGRLH